MNVLDLFSGIGGFSLGLERAGMRTVAFCEIEPYARAVLAKHWPNVPCYDDVRTLTADRLRADGIVPDVIAGGFPCQDISSAGRRAGLGGGKSSLFREYMRLIEECWPRWVIIENSARGAKHWVQEACSGLAALGYESSAFQAAASDIGANHERNRGFILAHAGRGRCALATEALCARGQSSELHPWWAGEPGISRVDDGFPNRVDRRRALGNAVVPQIPQIIGEAIMAMHRTF